MRTAAAPTPQASDNAEALAFVQVLGAQLSKGKVDLPGFPNIALRVRQVLADENVSLDSVVRVVESEPALAARLMQIANSEALNFTGKPITELRIAIARMGFNVVHSAAIAFAMSQLKTVDAFQVLEEPLDKLCRRSATVAAMSHAVARKFSRVNPDTAMLTGLLHGMGELCILIRSRQHPGLFADHAAYDSIVRDWQRSIAQALLKNWEMPEEIVTAVSEYEDFERQNEGRVDQTDVLTLGYLLASFEEHPETIELTLHEVAACKRMGIDRASYEKLVDQSGREIDTLRQALGA
jgi:HD-like signal output (HDOD) protein